MLKPGVPMGLSSARVTGPVTYMAQDGSLHAVPVGPCLVDLQEETPAEIIWGDSGEHCALLAPEALRQAQESGYLTVLA